MTTPSRLRALRAPRGQRGISLVVVLVLLVATSLLGVAVLRSAGMQERMSANLRDRSLAFQAAEAALRYAQDDVLGAVPTDPDDAWDLREPETSDCVTGTSICPPGSAPVWTPVPSGAFDAGAAGLAAAPEYWIEYLGKGPAYPGSCDTVPPSIDCQSPIYRVTARSRAEGRADVVLQANIISRIPTPGT